MYTLAIDLGTTTLAVSLIDCISGKRIAMSGAMNPQRRFGADVVSRLDAAVHSADCAREMTELIRSELAELAAALCRKTAIAWSDVQQIAIAGNPAMQHILMGLPLKSLAFPPFRPLYTGGTRLNANDLGWAGAADVYIFPMPGGFVGGDTVAFLYGQMNQGQEPGQTLFLDMGTNGEMALLAEKTIWATSAAAGPAFEGGNLSCGMAALPGAISSVRIEDDRVKLQVIGNGNPVGICGSAAIETISELLRRDILEPGGRLKEAAEIPSNLASRLITHQGANVFILYRDAQRLLYISQDDIRQVQLAKGAIRAGIEVLLERSHSQCQTLQNVVLTGSFGAVLRPEWLKTIGIFDDNMVHISRFTPEGALSGAELALILNDRFATVEELAERIRVVPLSGTPLFETKFMHHIDFPNF
ncbi:MAG: DUF4445 domain-containing protein [Deltaproteobacteria bacterium]|nr:DUF4445 domain-containing protein [Deltaproteobacteria bacterium]